MIQRESMKQTIRNFFGTTTLHGFKYFFADSKVDRLVWVISSCLSTVCAGLLCTVLWTRFLDVPAVLELRDLQARDTNRYMPVVAICPDIDITASILANNLTSNKTMAGEVQQILTQIISSQPTSRQSLEKLDMLLAVNKLSLSKLVFSKWPSCTELMLKCRWQETELACQSLFREERTPWGICCVMRPSLIPNAIKLKNSRLKMRIGLDLALQCNVISGKDQNPGLCRFFSMFEDLRSVEPMIILPEYNYFAQLRFSSILFNVGEDCNSNPDYSIAKCLDECAEKACSCLNPLNPEIYNTGRETLQCSAAQLECLLMKRGNTKCDCLPFCNKITTLVTLEMSRMSVLDLTLDPIYSDLNANASVLRLWVYTSQSRIFTINPTETWLSLLSSLGGVFNMFLGVGFISALEILLFLFVKVPIAFNNSAQITTVQSRGTD